MIKILIIDDEPGIRDSIAQWLERVENLECIVSKCSGRKHYLEEKLYEKEWDIAIVDLKLDGDEPTPLPGFGILMGLINRDSSTLCFVYSAHDTDQNKSFAAQIGGIFVPKTVIPTDLVHSYIVPFARAKAPSGVRLSAGQRIEIGENSYTVTEKYQDWTDIGFLNSNEKVVLLGKNPGEAYMSFVGLKLGFELPQIVFLKRNS